jgi:LuxR family maltose regulon positive regulatory protein
LRLAQADLVAAAHWVERSGLRVEGDLAYPDELGHLVLARVLLAHGRRHEALALLDRLHAAALDQHRTGSLLEICALQALALDIGGEEQAALDALAEALRLAAPQGHVRVFTDEGAPMAAVLTRLIAAERSGRPAPSIPLGFLARVQRSFAGPEPSEVAAARTAPPVDPLTTREREVLELMTAGMSNPAIAAQLVVSIDTVKKHVSHILDKLGARNRTEAVTRGRDIGISHLARMPR